MSVAEGGSAGRMKSSTTTTKDEEGEGKRAKQVREVVVPS
jgi:hypothetical protein